MTRSAWGDDQTQYFFQLTPERVLAAVEASGLLCTGRCSALGSYENRVYEVELEEGEMPALPGVPAGSSMERFARRRVAKFYRPGRWSEEQILEEHRFLADLAEAEVPVVAPIAFADGRTLHVTPDGIRYAIFPKVGGRAPEELSDEQLMRLGRLLARIHAVGASRPAPSRVRIGPDTYGRANLEFLLSRRLIPGEFEFRYRDAAEKICAAAEPIFATASYHRIHGDCHLSNLLWSDQGPFFLAFDDMLMGPAVQDVWLLVPGRDEEALRSRELLVEGYEEMRSFDRTQLRMVEYLRALRFIHYTAWLARRWEDPAFPQAFPDFGSQRYWEKETRDLEEQLRLVMGAVE